MDRTSTAGKTRDASTAREAGYVERPQTSQRREVFSWFVFMLKQQRSSLSSNFKALPVLIELLKHPLPGLRGQPFVLGYFVQRPAKNAAMDM